MATSVEIKNWIRAVREKKSFSDASILIQKEGIAKTKITLLDIACCSPIIIIDKMPKDIDQNDILEISGLINHQH
jgi:hypothetical protein